LNFIIFKHALKKLWEVREPIEFFFIIFSSKFLFFSKFCTKFSDPPHLPNQQRGGKRKSNLHSIYFGPNFPENYWGFENKGPLRNAWKGLRRTKFFDYVACIEIQNKVTELMFEVN
jgi:hypothetical protein